MSICAIVPVWNGRDLLARLLDTVEAQTLKPDEVLAIDNGSTDGAAELARRRGAHVISMGRNAGFAAAMNRGIRESRADWVAALNSDVELAPDYFEILSANDAWFATGKILAGPKAAATEARIDATYDVLCRGGCPWRVGSGRPDGPAFSTPRPIASPPWTAALFRAGLFHRVGFLEERFESYLEDVDFGLKCAAAGLDGIYDPRAVAWHRGSAALGRWHPETVRLIARNQVLLLARQYPRQLLLRWSWPIFVAHLLWGGVAFRHGCIGAWVRGKWQGIRGWSDARTHVQVTPKVLDRLIADERTLYAFQASTGFDLYWRLYFLLTAGGTK